MTNFQYFTPTKVVFGKDTESQVGDLAASIGCEKVLVHYGSQSAQKSGLLDRVFDSLKAAEVSYVSLGGVVPNPRLSKVYEGIDLCKKTGVDFILAIGGGSVIDSAKAIGYGIADSGDVWDFYSRKRVPKACAPIGCVLTISAAGSEMSNSSVITNENGALKRGYLNDLCRLKFAIMNPCLTFTLPVYQTMAGAVDIIMHTLERWFDAARNDTWLTDAMSASLIKSVIKNAPILKNDPSNYTAAAEMMWAGSLSHNGLMQACAGFGDWSAHQLEHELGGMFDVTHGAGLSAVWGSWARYVYRHAIPRFEALGELVFGKPDPLAAIGKMEEFFKSIDMPVTMTELAVKPTDKQIEELAEKCVFFGERKVGTVIPLGKEDIIKIFQAAR
ncbi:MAG: iron-containing alcohol dehydrogenase [Treponemataceae bacterium]|nr:MAG: iron-containing alcohol dehydrogenase [Treponemataceae bacterium]